MTGISGTGFGGRLAGYRKWAGYKTAADLAAAIPNPRMTAAVIQNIESGRKADLSVAQLLDLSAALDLSPVFLLAPVGRPTEPTDLANVGEKVGRMTSAELVEWFMADREPETEKALVANNILRRIRQMLEDVPEYRRLLAMPRTDLEPFTYTATAPDGSEYESTHNPMDAHIEGLGSLAGRIAANARFLRRYKNVDLSWAEDVISQVAGFEE